MPMSPELVQWRKAQRRVLLERRIAIEHDLRRAWNERITALLLTHFPVAAGMVVAGYWPFKGEFDPRFAMRAWRRLGARTALPCVTRKNGPLQFLDWWPGLRTTPGVFDLPVPQGSDIVLPDMVLMPPVGVDAMGYRLGYGGGYYDRTLAALRPAPLKIGVGFEVSRIDTIHPQPHDVPMDFLVTPEGVQCRSDRGLEPVERPGTLDWLSAPARRGCISFAR